MSRPVGITIVAIVLIFSGVFRVLIGLEAAGITNFGLAPAMPNAELIASTATIAGILTLIAAFGLFTVATWAWYLAIIVLIIRVSSDVIGLVSYATTSVAGGVTIADLVVSAVVLWYFFRPQVKEAFKVSQA
jgi:uncharacterized membrane protein (DUF2068 family)